MPILLAQEKLGKSYIDKSLHQTLAQLVEDKEIKLADKLKAEFKVKEIQD